MRNEEILTVKGIKSEDELAVFGEYTQEEQKERKATAFGWKPKYFQSLNYSEGLT